MSPGNFLCLEIAKMGRNQHRLLRSASEIPRESGILEANCRVFQGEKDDRSEWHISMAIIILFESVYIQFKKQTSQDSGYF